MYDRSKAKKGGFAQVREALQSFEGLVVRAEDGEWGGRGVDDEGKTLPPKSFFEVESTEVVPLEVTEELSMDISDSFSFRVNMSEWEGSFWVDEFLVSADKAKILLPDGLKGKRITWKKVKKTWNIDGVDRSYSNFIIDKVKAEGASPAPKVVKPGGGVAAEEATGLDTPDPMAAALKLAVGKTEAQFRMAVTLDPAFAASPLLPMAKAGVVTQALVNEGRLVLVGDKYQLP